MSISAILTLRLVKTDAASVVNGLMNNNWMPLGNQVEILPVGDKDLFSWERVSINELIQIVKSKEKCGEIVGVCLYWNFTDHGGQFLVYNDGIVTFSPTIERVLLTERSTDVSWYLEKLLPIFTGGDVNYLEDWEWKETT